MRKTRQEWTQQQWTDIQRLYYAQPGFDEGEGEERELLPDYYLESEGWEYEGDDTPARIDHDGLNCPCDLDFGEWEFTGCEETCGCTSPCEDVLRLRGEEALS